MVCHIVFYGIQFGAVLECVGWHIVFYGTEFGAVLEWHGLAHCTPWDRVWSSLGVVWHIIFSGVEFGAV